MIDPEIVLDSVHHTAREQNRLAHLLGGLPGICETVTTVNLLSEAAGDSLVSFQVESPPNVAQTIQSSTEEYLADRQTKLVDEPSSEQLALVVDHLNLADYLAGLFANKGVEFDDLRQVARVGLLNASKRFDPNYGSSFKTFASSTIEGELKRYFRDLAWPVKVDRSTKELRLRLGRVQQSLTHTFDREPTIQELAEALYVDEDAVVYVLLANNVYKTSSLDAPTSQDDEINLYAVLGQEDDFYAVAENRAVISELFKVLSEREVLVLQARYGLSPFEKSHTQQEIAKMMSTSQVHIGRIIKAALSRLKTSLNGTSTDDLL